MNFQIIQNMLRFSFCAYVCLFPGSSMAQWQQIPMPSTAYNLQTVSSSNAIYAYETSQPRLYRTTDYEQWNEVPLPPGVKMIHPVLTSNDTVIVIEHTDTGKIAHFSFDQGQTWPISNPAPSYGNGAFRYTNGRLISESGIIDYHYSNNFGATWQPRYVTFIPDWSLGRVVTHGSYLFFASEANAKVYRSVNGGITFVELPNIAIPFPCNFLKIQSVGGSLYLQLPGGWLKSVDNGDSWTNFTVNAQFGGGSLFQEGNRLYYTLGPSILGSSTFYSPDQGNTWVDMEKGVYQFGQGIITDGYQFSTDGGDTWKVGGWGLYNWWWNSLQKQYTTSHKLVFSGTRNYFRFNELTQNWELDPETNGYAFGTESENDIVIDYTFGGIQYSTDAGEHWTQGPLIFFQGNATIFQNLIYWGHTSNNFVSHDFGQTLSTVPNISPSSFIKLDTQLVALNGDGIYIANKSNPLDFSLTTFPLATNVNGYLGAATTLLAFDSEYLYVLNNGNWITANLSIDPLEMPNIYGAQVGEVNGQFYLILDILTQQPLERKYRIFHSSNNCLDWTEITSQFPSFVGPVISESNFALYLRDANHLYRITKNTPSISLAHGQVFADDNQNGVKESTEQGINTQLLKTKQGGIYTTSGPNGAFTIGYDDIQIDTIVPLLGPYHIVTSADAIINGATTTSSHDIGIYTLPNICDLQINMENTAQIRPGFQTEFQIKVKNVGTKPFGGLVRFPLNPEFELVSTSVAPQTQVADTLYFDLPTLQIGGVYEINIVVTTKVQTLIGSPVSVTATVITPSTDYYIQNNSSTLRRQVVGSYDPNDKSVSDDCLDPDFIQNNRLLYYTIRFQNTGNFPASFVRVTDTLHQNLQVGSIEVVAASHPFNWTLKGRNILDVFFDNIHLPDSTSNELESHGYIKFAIKADSMLQIGNKIENKALIYFDYNMPITTNTVRSDVKIDRVQEIESDMQTFMVTPNPGKRDFTVQLTQPILEPALIQIFDLNGRLIAQQRFSQLPSGTMLPTWNTAAGVYFVQITTETRTQTQRLIVE